MSVQERAAEVLGAHWYTRVTSDCELACQCGHTFDQTCHRDHQAQMLADAGLLADTGWWEGVNDQWKSERSIRGGHRLSEFANPYRGDAPVAGGNGAVSAEPCPPRPTTHTTPDGAIDARLVAQRAATDAWKARAEELGERLDEAHAKIERMEAL